VARWKDAELQEENGQGTALAACQVCPSFKNLLWAAEGLSSHARALRGG